LTVANYGVFTSKYTVRYFLSGYELVFESDGLTQNQKRQLVIPGQAYDVTINIQLMTFLVRVLKIIMKI
jgi:hypothetical protein